MFAHAQAPVRVGIAGGGTDLPAWTRAGRGGRCLSLAIATRTYAVVIARPDRRVVASYRQLDEASCATEIANGLIRESALLHGFQDGFEVHTLSEVSSRGSGLGVSSSLAVALAAVFHRMRCIVDGEGGARHEDLPLAEYLAKSAWTVEIDRLRRPIGRQDHMAAAHGGLRLYAFEGEGARVERTFDAEEARWVARHLALIALPDGHDSRAILAGVTGVGPLEVARSSVDVAVEAIAGRDPHLLGRALDMGQASKAAIPGAVPARVADVVRRVREYPGVHGCKVAGAGGGGHLVVACDPGVAGDLGALAELPVSLVEPEFCGVRCGGWR